MTSFKRIRRKAGFSQTDVALLTGVKQNAVSQWENGIALPRAALLPKIAKLYGCTIDELLGYRKEGEGNDH